MSEMFPVQGNVNAEVKADTTPLVQAMADVVVSSNKGVRKILNALFGKWIAKNERSVALIQAQTEKDCADIRSGVKVYRDDALLVCPEPVKVVDVYDSLHTLNHMSDARRLRATIEEAIRQIAEVPPDEITEEPLSQTFFNHWRREAEMIDENELRQWWARILVEETKKANSITPRTLEVARCLSREEANLFQRMIKGEVDGVIPLDNKGHPQYINYSEALALQSAGLIFAQASERTFALSYDIDQQNKGVCVPLYDAGLVLCVHKNTYSANCFILSEAGRCLLPIAQLKRTLDDYISIATRMSSLSDNTIMSLHRIVKKHGGQVFWDKMAVWSGGKEGSSTQES